MISQQQASSLPPPSKLCPWQFSDQLQNLPFQQPQQHLLPAEPRSVLDLSIPSPASSSVCPSLGSASCESGETRHPIEYDHRPHGEKAEPIVEQQLQALIGCGELESQVDEELQLGQMSASSGEEAIRNSQAMSDAALWSGEELLTISNQFVEEQSLEEVFGCLVEQDGGRRGQRQIASPGYGGHCDTGGAGQLFGQACEPKSLLNPASLFPDLSSMPVLSIPWSVPESKRPRSTLMQPYPHRGQSTSQYPLHHSCTSTENSLSFPLPHHPYPDSLPFPRRSMSYLQTSIICTPPIHFPDRDSHHIYLTGKTVPHDEVLLTSHQLTIAAEAAELGNTQLSQAILARLNLFSIKPHRTHATPLQRAASLFSEAIINQADSAPLSNLIAKISAHKSFCDTSLLPQFSHLAANQSSLEAIKGHHCVHVIDFELGVGERWASFMRELVLKGRAPARFILSAVVCGLHDGLLLQLAKESLLEFARGLNLILMFDVVPVAKLCSLMRPSLEQEALVVNVGSSALAQLLAELGSSESLLSLLHFIQSLTPTIVTMPDSECFVAVGWSSFMNQALKHYACVMETLDYSGADTAAIVAIEDFVLSPQIKNVVKIRRLRQNMPLWGSLLQRVGFSPMPGSAVAEAQVKCLLRGANTGFSLEKQQFSLALSWHGINLIQVSSWKS